MKNLKVSEGNHNRFMRLKQYPWTQDDFVGVLLTLYEKTYSESKKSIRGVKS